jgi:hypothetical protein
MKMMSPSEPPPNRWNIPRVAVIALLLMATAGTSFSVAAQVTVSTPTSTLSNEDAEVQLLDLDAANFGANSADIDNEWSPLTPGTRLVYAGLDIDDEGQRVPHVVVDTVTDLTKEINGVRTRISIEEDYSDEELVEKDIRFNAQDNDGNVWHLGELVETYEDGAFVGAQVWIGGVTEGAHPGIQMLAAPQVGDTYSQGFAPPPFYWTDRARVHMMGQQTTVQTGSYDDVMVIAEWDQETMEGVFQDKYYARGVGVVRVGFRGPDPQQEELELVGMEQLSPIELADVRADVLRMEERAYLYSQTSPAETDDMDADQATPAADAGHGGQGQGIIPGRSTSMRGLGRRTRARSAFRLRDHRPGTRLSRYHAWYSLEP